MGNPHFKLMKSSSPDASSPPPSRKTNPHSVLVGAIGRAMKLNISLPGLGHRKSPHLGATPQPGAIPGIESILDTQAPPSPGSIHITCVDFGPDYINTQEIEDFDKFLQTSPQAEGRIRWLNINGLHPWIVDKAKNHYGFHTLSAEDVLKPHQRPKLEEYEDHLFIVMRMMQLKDSQFESEQVSIFLYPGLLITFQERPGDVWQPVRERLTKPESRLRKNDASYLLYTLLDGMVDHCFPILEQYGDQLEALEETILAQGTTENQRAIHNIKRELSLLRRIIWPTRELVSQLSREDAKSISPYARNYMRDVYDHSIQVMDIVETYREMTGGLNDLYMSVVSNRMNEIMKVLTIMASFFIPTTFIAGVYGMNFEHIPELSMPYGYVFFWSLMLLMFGGMAAFFWRKGWIGKP